MLITGGLAMRQISDGWWSVRAEHGIMMRLAGPGMVIACLMMIPAGFGVLSLAFADSVRGSMAAFVAGLALTVVAFVRMARRGGTWGGRHCRSNSQDLWIGVSCDLLATS